jgi:hypothetical protein
MIRSLTYAELAESLRITPESANRLARRKRWPRLKGNDGRVRVTVPEDALVRRDDPPDRPPYSPDDRPPDNQVHAQIARLEGELVGVREALGEARARAEAAEARAEKQAIEFAARDAQHAAALAAERSKTEAERAKAEKAINEFAALADRLTMLAAERSRPWWRRLVG